MSAFPLEKPREVFDRRVYCIPSLHTLLVDLDHDVVSARDGLSHATDEELLALAYEQQRVLVTEDKDFGELVFVRRLPHPCIVRFVEMQVVEKVAAMHDLIERYADAMQEGALIVVTRGLVRLRSARNKDQGED